MSTPDSDEVRNSAESPSFVSRKWSLNYVQTDIMPWLSARVGKYIYFKKSKFEEGKMREYKSEIDRLTAECARLEEAVKWSAASQIRKTSRTLATSYQNDFFTEHDGILRQDGGKYLCGDIELGTPNHIYMLFDPETDLDSCDSWCRFCKTIVPLANKDNHKTSRKHVASVTPDLQDDQIERGFIIGKSPEVPDRSFRDLAMTKMDIV